MGDSGRFRITHDQRHYHYLASSQVPSGYRRWTADTDAAPYGQHNMRAFLDGGARKRSKIKSLPILLIAQLGICEPKTTGSMVDLDASVQEHCALVAGRALSCGAEFNFMSFARVDSHGDCVAWNHANNAEESAPRFRALQVAASMSWWSNGGRVAVTSASHRRFRRL